MPIQLEKKKTFLYRKFISGRLNVYHVHNIHKESLIQTYGSHSRRSKGPMFLGVAENNVKFCCLHGIYSGMGRSEISSDSK